MSTIVWDAVGSRTYEAGIDRGVLYAGANAGVGWSGLTGVNEDRSDGTTTPYFLDGVKYLDVASSTDFSATLTALTYPEEFEPYDGFGDVGAGVFLDNQPVGTFGLCYRTRIGTDQDAAAGYKIHLLYNLTATPTSKEYKTDSSNVDPIVFSWGLTAVPIAVSGYRPTAHLIINAREVSPDTLAVLEGYLYGTDDSDSFLPEMQDVIDLMQSDRLIDVPDGANEIIFDGGVPDTAPTDGGSPNPGSGDTVLDGGAP